MRGAVSPGSLARPGEGLVGLVVKGEAPSLARLEYDDCFVRRGASRDVGHVFVSEDSVQGCLLVCCLFVFGGRGAGSDGIQLGAYV